MMKHARTLPRHAAGISVVALLAFVSAFAATPWWLGGAAAIAIAEEDIEGPFEWGDTPNVRRVGPFWVAGQIDEAGLARAKDVGVATVLDLRDPGEHPWNERAAVEALGLRYFNVPVAGTAYDEDAMNEITRLFETHVDDGLLLHCSSGNRVAGWLATYLVTERGFDTEAALAIARRAGLTKPAAEAEVRAYLARTNQPAPALPAGDG